MNPFYAQQYYSNVNNYINVTIFNLQFNTTKLLKLLDKLHTIILNNFY